MNHRLFRRLALSALGAALLTAGLVATLGAQTPTPGQSVSAQLVSSTGQPAGSVQLTQQGAAVRLVVNATGLPPGFHGIHIHAVGRCDPPAFTTAGAHFNPTGRTHGLLNPAGPHAGDLPQLTVNASGSGTLDVTNDRVTLLTGGASLFDADGSALVIHANADDQVTDPTGNSGDRIACAVLVASQTPAATATAAPAGTGTAAAPGPARTGDGPFVAADRTTIGLMIGILALVSAGALIAVRERR